MESNRLWSQVNILQAAAVWPLRHQSIHLIKAQRHQILLSVRGTFPKENRKMQNSHHSHTEDKAPGRGARTRKPRGGASEASALDVSRKN